MKGAFSLRGSLESLQYLDFSRISRKNGKYLFVFPHSWDSLESLRCLRASGTLENGPSEKTPFPKDPSSNADIFGIFAGRCASDNSWEFPNLVVSNLVVCNFYAEALFCALLRSFADLRLRSFALICALLRTFACFCERLRLERPRLGTPEILGFLGGGGDSLLLFRKSPPFSTMEEMIARHLAPSNFRNAMPMFPGPEVITIPATVTTR